jgi:hypothetical protein
MRLTGVRFSLRSLMGAVAIMASVCGWVEWHRRYPGRAFDAVAWKDPVQVARGVRGPTADRLVAWKSLLGKTRSQVVQLLGEPVEAKAFPEWDSVYFVGPERGFISIDDEWLGLRFGPDGRVVKCQLTTD